MKYLLAGISGLLALAALNAARAEPRSAPATYSWAGCYVGVNGGYGWNNGSSSYRDSNSISDPLNFVPPAFGIFGTPVLSYIPTPSGTAGSGGLAGGSGGCNYQSQQWVIGFEADIDWAHISRTSNTSAISAPTGQFQIGPGVFSGAGVAAAASEQVSLRWLSTIRARGGVLVSDRLLVFATGGLALGGINSQGSVNNFLGPSTSSPVGTLWSGSTTTTRVGGVVGGGLEWAWSAALTVKAEYLWYTFGNVSHPLNCSYENGFVPCLNDVYPTLGSASASVYGSIVRLGINYQFR
jgi:outer membrane immunogenic protein